HRQTRARMWLRSDDGHRCAGVAEEHPRADGGASAWTRLPPIITVAVIPYGVMSDPRRIGSAVLFPTDHPLDPGTMIGRAVDVDRIAMALVGGGNVVLAGPGRAGKRKVAGVGRGCCP